MGKLFNTPFNGYINAISNNYTYNILAITSMNWVFSFDSLKLEILIPGIRFKVMRYAGIID